MSLERIHTPGALDGEDELDRSLRPRSLEEFVGQDGLREQLQVSIEAASARGEALDHVLLAGPPGLGKTSLAQIIATELEVPFVQTAGPALERKGDIAALLSALEPRAVFFVDEVHRLNRGAGGDLLSRPWRTGGCRSPSARARGPGRHPRPAAVHAHRRHDPRRTADHAAARPLRHPAPLRALRRRRTSRGSCAARPRSSTSRSTTAGRGHRRALARHAARGQPPAQARARLGRGARQRRSSTTPAADAALAMLEVDELGPRPPRPRDPHHHLRAVRAAARSASRRWPSPSTRRPTPSRTSTSPTCSSAGSSSARRAAARPRARAYEHLGLDPPRESALF